MVYGMSRKPKTVSVTSIAAELGISPSAVSRAINNRAGVSETVRTRVAGLLDKYHFRPAYPASRLPRIAVVSGRGEVSPYLAGVLSGIYRYVQKGTLSATAVIHPTLETGKLLDLIRDQQCSGVILLVPAHFAEGLPKLADAGLPIMLVDETTSLPGCGFIDNDSYSGALEAARFLTGLGHRRIGCLGSRTPTENHRQRFLAWRNALAEIGLDPDPQLHLHSCPVSCNEMEYGRYALTELLKDAPDITAVMAANDEIAAGAMAAARQLGRKIPEELSITGFDDNPFAAFLEPPLTTVRHDMEQAGYLAAEALDAFLQKKTPLPRTILPTRLVVRNSCAPPYRGSHSPDSSSVSAAPEG